MKVELVGKTFSAVQADVLVMGVYEGDKKVECPPSLKDQAKAVLGKGMKGALKSMSLLHGKGVHVLLVGLGKKGEVHLQQIREVASSAALYCEKQGYTHIALCGLGLDTIGPEAVAAAVEGAMLGTYSFLKYKTEEKKKKELAKLTIVVPPKDLKKVKPEFTRAVHISESANNIRNLGNEPSNVATPKHLAAHAKAVAKKWGLKCTIFDEKEIYRRKMGGLIAVTKGSKEPPRFIILEHKGKKGADTICVVGKGITFDSGGISIKPGQAMDEMKFDMCGAAATLGVLEACARTKVPLNVVGIVPTCENMPSATAYKPGDVITTLSKKTIEILNTDAEGRIILSDGLHYASTKFKPKVIFDMATLTGAVIVALGSHTCGVMGNEQKYIDRLIQASKSCGEKAWQLPLWDEFRNEVKSDIADVKNLGKSREAGTIAAAALLEHFVHGTPWVHLDIAGVAWTNSPRAEFQKGATGFGVRLLLETFRQWKK